MVRMQEVYGIFEKIRSVDIAVHQQRCVAVRNRKANCMRCAEACTSKAISLEENELVIAPEKCIGCGTCATVCPTCALEALHPNDAELLRAAVAAAKANGGVAVLACRQIVEAAREHLAADRCVAVECLGRVEESLITSLAVAGASRVVLVKADCASCEHAVGLNTAKDVVACANELLAMWNSPVRADIVDRFPPELRQTEATAFDEGRRNFFFRTKEQAKLAAEAAAAHALEQATGETPAPPERYVKVMDDGTLPHFIPDRRERLLDNLAALGEPEGGLLTGRLWGHVEIDTKACISCRMCATFCPTGALRKFDDEDGTLGLDHFPVDCVRCRCCEDICPEHAITVFSEALAEDLLQGVAERTVLRPPKYDMSSPTRARTMFRDLLGYDGIYDR